MKKEVPMQNEKIKFSDLYENFTGSGNINGKYWIVGLESGGEIDFEDKNNELIEGLHSKNIIRLLNYFNDFDQEFDSKSNFLRKEKDFLAALKMTDKHLIVCNDGKEYFHYPKCGEIFRTNLYMLNQRSIKDPIYKEYSDYFDFKTYIPREDLYNEQLIKRRATQLQNYIDNSVKEKVLFIHIPVSKNEIYISFALKFISKIFNLELKAENIPHKFNNKRNYYTEYKSNNEEIRIIHFSQERTLQLEDYIEALNSLGII